MEEDGECISGRGRHASPDPAVREQARRWAGQSMIRRPGC